MLAVERAIDVLRTRPRTGERPLSPNEADAVAELYVRYADALRVVARRIVRNRADAEDVVHDVFFRLPAAIALYRDGRFGGWLMQMTARTALMRIRRTRRRPEHVSLDLAVASIEASLPVAHAPALGVRRLVAQLPDALRDVTILRFFFDCSHREIADALGITAAASEVRLCRALKRLRDVLPDDFAPIERSA